MGSPRIFVLSNDEVSGPFSEFELKQRLGNNEFENPLLWWRGLSEWLDSEHWQNKLQETQERTLAKAERLWLVKVGSKEFPAMSHIQMMDLLRLQDDLGEIRIWTEGYEEWREVFQIHPIMEELGVSRRKYPRVALSGTISLLIAGTTYDASPTTISEGGIGLMTKAPLIIGERVSVTIRSAQLYTGITTSAEVVYVDSRGHAGLRFEGLNSEARAAIIEYVKRFRV